MKQYMLIAALQIAVIGLSGCGQSAQEKLAQEQLKAMEQQKLMVQGFENAAKKANAEAEEHRGEKLKPIDWNATLHPNKK